MSLKILGLEKIVKKVQKTVKSFGQLVHDKADLEDIIDLFKTIIDTAKKIDELEKRVNELENKWNASRSAKYRN